MEVSLGGGAAIKVKDASLICTPAVRNFMVKIAEDQGIKYQTEVLQTGGTDSAAIQMTKTGIPTGAISIPCRYIHSPCEMVDLGDLEECVKLAKRFARIHWNFRQGGRQEVLTQLDKVLGLAQKRCRVR